MSYIHMLGVLKTTNMWEKYKRKVLIAFQGQQKITKKIKLRFQAKIKLKQAVCNIQLC